MKLTTQEIKLRESTKEFLADTNYASPAEAIRAGTRTIEQWRAQMNRVRTNQPTGNQHKNLRDES